jgi:hypothetical protein
MVEHLASDKNDMSPVSPLVRSREWVKSEFNVGHSRVAVQTLRMNSGHCLLGKRKFPPERIFGVYYPGTD